VQKPKLCTAKRTVEDEGRTFQSKWEEEYLLSQMQSSICLRLSGDGRLFITTYH